MPSERLQKILARAGFGSRRHAETVIAAGRVTVNGAPATLGMRADAEADRIEVDGAPIHLAPGDVTVLLHKPVGVVVTATDDRGRRTVYDLLPEAPPHLRYVGRLDQGTSGLLLLTTDGELGHRLTHPRFEVPKTYEATVDGVVPDAALDQLRRGVPLEDGMTAPAVVERLPGGMRPTRLRLVIHEGRNRQVRRMFEALGCRVLSLTRTRVGPLALDGLPVGASRAVTSAELEALRALVGLAAAS